MLRVGPPCEWRSATSTTSIRVGSTRPYSLSWRGTILPIQPPILQPDSLYSDQAHRSTRLGLAALHILVVIERTRASGLIEHLIFDVTLTSSADGQWTVIALDPG